MESRHGSQALPVLIAFAPEAGIEMCITLCPVDPGPGYIAAVAVRGGVHAALLAAQSL